MQKISGWVYVLGETWICPRLMGNEYRLELSSGLTLTFRIRLAASVGGEAVVAFVAHQLAMRKKTFFEPADQAVPGWQIKDDHVVSALQFAATYLAPMLSS